MDPTLYKVAVKGITSDGDLSLVEYLKRDEENGYQVTPKGNTVLHVAALYGHSHFVGEVLKIIPALLCHQNQRNESALHIAANEGHTEVVRVLLSIASEENYKETLVRMTNENGDTALHKAVRSGHFDVVKIILEKEEDPEYEYPANKAGETPLYLAAESGFCVILREILKSCKNPNYAAGPFGRTPLHAAVVLEHSDCARLLWQWNNSLCEEPDKWGWNPLHYAVKLGLTGVVSDILGWKNSLAYLRAGSENDWTTAIHIAASEGYENVLSELLQHCPDCWEMLNSRGQNALHVAVMNEKANLLLELLKSQNWGSLVDEPDNDGNTPMHLLAFGKYINKDKILPREFTRRKYVPDELRYHPKAKKMTFNKDNQTPLDILSRAVTEKSKSEEEYDNLYPFRLGQFGRRGFKIKSQEEEALKTWRRHQTKWAANEYWKNERKFIMEIAQIHLVVATLLMTITFAAGFTLPGGFESDPNSSNKGMAILISKTAFRAFVVSDAIAFSCSAGAVVSYFIMALINKYSSEDTVSEDTVGAMSKFANVAILLQLLAMSAVVIAFVTGMYAALAHSIGLAVTVCAIGCISFLLYVVRAFRIVRISQTVIRLDDLGEEILV
ncbi:protein ACCELERATED CELL DEATH 6-like [Lycium barbarum]|uniref:protein ACCELERATED CELL DEATH 6-like n=1 Tax=Lycium barbarum TaxID=112863 RepID=UPI00293E5285|nr:protein ACCELERATED CELL DEATH 6-like [Lycium barbarum]